jgi:hypothetical protein
MGIHPPALPWLHKPAAMRLAAQLVVDSALSSRGYPGYLDVAESEPLWVPPRTQRAVFPLGETRPFTAPPDALERAFGHLDLHRRGLPAGTFVFVLSDFLAPPAPGAWQDAVARGWDVVAVVIQDPVWERSFPDVAGVAVPIADPRTGEVALVRLSRRQVLRRRREHEARYSALQEHLRSFGVEVVEVTSSDPAAVDGAFVAWAEDRRRQRWSR